MFDFLALAQQCAPAVHPSTMAAVVRVESAFNPYAIGVVGSALKRQPRTKAEAVATAVALEAAGVNFSLGMGQVNRGNLRKYGLTYESAFEPCNNLRAASQILKECFDRAKTTTTSEQQALHASLSCYYSGNFSTGFRPERPGHPSYVNRILSAAGSHVQENSSQLPTPPRAKTKRSNAHMHRKPIVKLTGVTENAIETSKEEEGGNGVTVYH